MSLPPTDESLRVILYRHRKWFGIVAFGSAVAIGLVQHFKPFPPKLAPAIFGLLQAMFWSAVVGLTYFKYLYRVDASPQTDEARDSAAKASNMPEALVFWTDVRRRRFQYFLAGPGWLLAGGPIFFFYRSIFSAGNWQIAGMATVATWACVLIWTKWRVTSVKCFHCGQTAFERVPSIMSRAKCCNCGVQDDPS